MAQLKSGRATTSSFIGGAPGTFGAIEQAISEITGIPLDEDISSPIFGSIGGTGTIGGVLRLLKSNSAESDPENKGGIKFQDSASSKMYKISCTNNTLRLYEYNSADASPAWAEIADLTNLADQWINLSDTPDAWGNAGEFVKVNATEDGLEFGSGGGGADDMEDLSDVDAYVGGSGGADAGKVLMVSDVADRTKWAALASASPQDLGDLTDVDLSGLHTLASLGQMIEYKQTGPASFGWQEEPKIIAIGEGIREDGSNFVSLAPRNFTQSAQRVPIISKTKADYFVNNRNADELINAGYATVDWDLVDPNQGQICNPTEYGVYKVYVRGYITAIPGWYVVFDVNIPSPDDSYAYVPESRTLDNDTNPSDNIDLGVFTLLPRVTMDTLGGEFISSAQEYNFAFHVVTPFTYYRGLTTAPKVFLNARWYVPNPDDWDGAARPLLYNPKVIVERLR